ncbi:formin-like protein 5 [Microtus oregoni]|uniref:formin-like protein 5 n=1 Tax=Microtus oregoni TaxID=111838 RepID=UPI001BB2891F|nr:formin-like protein 5 [Microtus oregoni]
MELFFEELVRQVLIISTSENYFFGHVIRSTLTRNISLKLTFQHSGERHPTRPLTKVATDLRPESRDTSSSPGARDQNRGSEKLGLTPPPLRTPSPCRQSTLPPPPPTHPTEPPGLRAGARPGHRRERDCWPRRLPPPLPPPPPPGECSGVCPVKPPYQSRPLLQRRRRRRSSAASAAALCFPLLRRRSSAARLGRPDPTSHRYALPPSRPPASPSSPRPPPPSPPRRRRRRHRRRRLLFRAPLVFIESKQASWRRPPSPSHPSQRAPRSPPPRQHPGFPLADTAGRNHSATGGGGSSRAVAQARSPFPHASRSNEPAQRAPARPPVLSSRSLCA